MVQSSRYRNPQNKPAWYKARQRSVTPAQKAAERALWPLYGLSFAYNRPIDLAAAFRRRAPTTLEIGCGSGEALVELAAARPEHGGPGERGQGVAAAVQDVEVHELL